MIMTKKSLLLLLTAFMLGLPALADEAVDKYMTTTNPIMSEIKQLDKQYIAEVQPLRKARDLKGLKDAADRYVALWSVLGTKLVDIPVPDDTKVYHDAMKRMIELQVLSNSLMSKIVGDAIVTSNEAKAMKEAGKSDEEIKTFLNSKGPERKETIDQLKAVGQEAKQMDKTLVTEFKRLNPK